MTAAGYDLAVLGGGPAGLTAALLAARAGHRVILIERSSTLGGMARSIDVDGISVDLGSHRLHPSASARVRDLIDEVTGGDLQLRPRNGRLLLGSSWVGFPLQATELLRAIRPTAAMQIACGAMIRPPFVARARAARASTYADAVRAKLGGWMYREFYSPFAEKLWGLPGEQIDAEQARVRVSADSPWSVLTRILRSGRTNTDNEQGKSFFYPRRGFGQIVAGLESACTAAGVRLATGSVTAVDPGADEVRVEIADQSPVTAAHVLSSVPLTVLAGLVPGSPAMSAGLAMRGMVLVYLTHHGGRWTPYDAHYVPGRSTPVTRISEPANYRSSADDPPDRSVVCFEIPCDAGKAEWMLTDVDLLAVATSALSTCGLPPIDHRDQIEVVRLPHVYPKFERGYRSKLAPLETWVDGLPRITAIGRLGLFAHDNTHHAMDSAYEAVTAVRPDGTRDESLWAAARERFSAHVVED